MLKTVVLLNIIVKIVILFFFFYQFNASLLDIGIHLKNKYWPNPNFDDTHLYIFLIYIKILIL